MSAGRQIRCSNSGSGVAEAWGSSLVEVRTGLHLDYQIVEELDFVPEGRILALVRKELQAAGRHLQTQLQPVMACMEVREPTFLLYDSACLVPCLSGWTGQYWPQTPELVARPDLKSSAALHRRANLLDAIARFHQLEVCWPSIATLFLSPSCQNRYLRFPGSLLGAFVDQIPFLGQLLRSNCCLQSA